MSDENPADELSEIFEDRTFVAIVEYFRPLA